MQYFLPYFGKNIIFPTENMFLYANKFLSDVCIAIYYTLLDAYFCELYGDVSSLKINIVLGKLWVIMWPLPPNRNFRLLM